MERMREEVPAEATRILLGIVRTSTLGRIVVLESLRRRVVLRDANGTDLGEIDDDLVTVAHGTQKGLSFRQIEFELAGDLPPEDHDDLVRAVSKKLRKAGAYPETEQKFAKALGDAAAITTTAQGLKDGIGRRASVQDIVRLAITDGLERVLDYDYLLRLDLSDPPVRAVHQARVACRRLRSDLKTYGPLLDQEWLQRTTTELRWIGGRLGQVRDADVLAVRLGVRPEDAADAGVDGSGYLRERLAGQRRTAGATLAEDMASRRYVDLLDRLHSAALAPPFSSAKRRSPGVDQPGAGGRSGPRRPAGAGQRAVEEGAPPGPPGREASVRSAVASHTDRRQAAPLCVRSGGSCDGRRGGGDGETG